MSLVFSAFVPHSPILIPSIGKEHRIKLENTLKAYDKLAEELKLAQPETIIIISPHGLIQPFAFTLNLCPDYKINFADFGDLATEKKWQGDLITAQTIKENLAGQAPISMISQPELDYGTSVPLFLLTKDLNQIKIIPFFYAELNRKNHFAFGKKLRKEILAANKRIAVIASGDLSHCLSKDAPAGYRPDGKKFDKKFLSLLKEAKFIKIMDIDPELIKNAGECGVKSALVLGGILDGSNAAPKLLSYEYPFGVGCAVIYFALN